MIMIFLALFAASIEPIFVKLSFHQGLPPFQIIIIKNLLASLMMFFIFRIDLHLWKKKGGHLFFLAILLFTTTSSMIYALEELPAVLVITGVSTIPALVAIVNQLRGRDQSSVWFWPGLLCCFLGVLLSLQNQPLTIHEWSLQSLPSLNHLPPRGLRFLFQAMICSTIYRTLLDQLTLTIPPHKISAALFAILGLFCLGWGYGTYHSFHPLKTQHFFFLFWMATAAVMANVAFLKAIKVVGSTRMSVFDMLQRPIVMVLTSFVLKEKLFFHQWVGVGFVLLGISMAKVQRKKS
jgi:drug/metabolite transporter (DMT)-like permease